MATQTVTVCDVFGIVKGVKRFRVTVQEVDSDGAAVGAPAVCVDADLSARALQRVRHSIQKAVNPVGWRQEKGGAN